MEKVIEIVELPEVPDEVEQALSAIFSDYPEITSIASHQFSVFAGSISINGFTLCEAKFYDDPDFYNEDGHGEESFNVFKESGYSRDLSEKYDELNNTVYDVFDESHFSQIVASAISNYEWAKYTKWGGEEDFLVSGGRESEEYKEENFFYFVVVHKQADGLLRAYISKEIRHT